MKHLCTFCVVLLVWTSILCVPTAQAGRVEDYYYKITGTWSFSTYSPWLQRSLKEARLPYTPTEIERVGIPLSGEVGIYWPITVSERYLLVGINCTFFRNRSKWLRSITAADTVYQEEAVFSGLFSGTLQYYPVSRIGSGPFVRLDMGLAMGNIYQKAENIEYPGKTWTGLGVLGGIGYAIPVFTGTHLTVEAWYAVRDVQEYYTTALHVGLGVMW